MNRKYEEVVTEYITDSINDSAMDILIDCTEDYLERCGYDISRTAAIGRYLTSGMSGTAKRFFDNCWDAIETLGLSDMYSAYSTISDFAPDLITIIIAIQFNKAFLDRRCIIKTRGDYNAA